MITTCKMGFKHREEGTNKQDFVVPYRKDGKNDLAIPYTGLKLVLDGCGSMPYSEVGAILFGQQVAKLYSENTPANLAQFDKHARRVMENLLYSGLFVKSALPESLSFTVLAVIEFEDEFVVFTCGDGYVVSQKHGGKVDLVCVENGSAKIGGDDYPKYLIYDFMKPAGFENGVSFDTQCFPKDIYKNVGVATDGVRFIADLPAEERLRFYEFLDQDKHGKLNMLINRNLSVFKDDISICF